MTASAPRCRWCGKPLRKQVRTVWCYAEDSGVSRDYPTTAYGRNQFLPARPKTKAECQRYSDGTVVSVAKDRDGNIRRFGEWDGESYTACYEFFCTNDCAARFGRAAAKDTTLRGYHD